MGLPAPANGALDNEADRVEQTLLDPSALPGPATRILLAAAGEARVLSETSR
jgi:hypothetical protein